MNKKIKLVVVIIGLFVIGVFGYQLVKSKAGKSGVAYSNKLSQDVTYIDGKNKYVSADNLDYDVVGEESIKLKVLPSGNKMVISIEGNYAGENPEVIILEDKKNIKTETIDNGKSVIEIVTESNKDYILKIQLKQGKGTLKISIE